MQNFNPIGRTNNLVVQEYENEVLVYDLTDHRAMSLNETSARVWRACDGQKSVSDIAAEIGNEGITLMALSKLKKAKLVDADTPELAKFEGMPRREAIKKIGLGAMLAFPVIASVAAPTAAQTGTCLAVGAALGNATGSQNCGQTDQNTLCTSTFGSRCCSGNAVASSCSSNPAVVVCVCG